MLHGRVCFAGSRSSHRTRRGSGHSVPIVTNSLLARRREPSEDHEVRLRQSAEAECTPKNRIAKEYLGGGRE